MTYGIETFDGIPLLVEGITSGKNIFNPNTNNKLVGFFVNATNGVVRTNATYSAVMLSVKAGEKISFNSQFQGAVHVAFFSQYSDISTKQDWQAVSGYISGFSNVAEQGYTVPSGAVAMTVSYLTARESTLQVEYGNSSTTYQKYMIGIESTNVIGYSVLPVGSGQKYTTIQAAVNAASDGDTIFIYPGTYNEAVDVNSTGKNLRLIGYSRDSVILQYSGGDYYYPPLEMSKGFVANMTIKCTATAIDEGAIAGAYCVHVDYDNSINNSLQIVNVRCSNVLQPCIGIGLRSNFRLSLIDCDFYTVTKNALYCHEQQASNITGQYVEIINCSVKTDAAAEAIRLQESPAYTGKVATIRMQRVIAKNAGSVPVVQLFEYGQSTGLHGDGYLGSNMWVLDDVSALNSDSIMDA